MLYDGGRKTMITDEEFLRIAAYMKSHYGIDLGQKKVIMNGRLENRIKAGGWGTFNNFMDAMEKDQSGKLEKELVNQLIDQLYLFYERVRTF